MRYRLQFWGTRIGPKPEYSSNPYYLKLVHDRIEKLNAPEEYRTRLLKSSISRRILKAVRMVIKFLLYSGLTILAIAFIASQKDADKFISAIVAIVFFGGMNWLDDRFIGMLTSVENKVLLAHKPKLDSLDQDAETCRREVLQLWDKHNVSFRGYPPDWDERRETVKSRDNHICKKCGWPRGVKRRRRIFHVHHVLPLSKGGDNSLSNLVTLCNKCHSKEEGHWSVK